MGRRKKTAKPISQGMAAQMAAVEKANQTAAAMPPTVTAADAAPKKAPVVEEKPAAAKGGTPMEDLEARLLEFVAAMGDEKVKHAAKAALADSFLGEWGDIAPIVSANLASGKRALEALEALVPDFEELKAEHEALKAEHEEVLAKKAKTDKSLGVALQRAGEFKGANDELAKANEEAVTAYEAVKEQRDQAKKALVNTLAREETAKRLLGTLQDILRAKGIRSPEALTEHFEEVVSKKEARKLREAAAKGDRLVAGALEQQRVLQARVDEMEAAGEPGPDGRDATIAKLQGDLAAMTAAKRGLVADLSGAMEIIAKLEAEAKNRAAALDVMDAGLDKLESMAAAILDEDEPSVEPVESVEEDVFDALILEGVKHGLNPFDLMAMMARVEGVVNAFLARTGDRLAPFCSDFPVEARAIMSGARPTLAADVDYKAFLETLGNIVVEELSVAPAPNAGPDDEDVRLAAAYRRLNMGSVELIASRQRLRVALCKEAADGVWGYQTPTLDGFVVEEVDGKATAIGRRGRLWQPFHVKAKIGGAVEDVVVTRIGDEEHRLVLHLAHSGSDDSAGGTKVMMEEDEILAISIPRLYAETSTAPPAMVAQQLARALGFTPGKFTHQAPRDQVVDITGRRLPGCPLVNLDVIATRLAELASELG